TSLLSSYSGRSLLSTWLRGVARLKGYETRREGRRRQDLGKVDATAGPKDAHEYDVDPELEFLRRHFSEEFKAAVVESLSVLAGADRSLLRRHLVEDLSAEEIGALLGVHRATAARRLARVRKSLAKRIHARLSARLGIGLAEAEELRRLVAGKLELSL